MPQYQQQDIDTWIETLPSKPNLTPVAQVLDAVMRLNTRDEEDEVFGLAAAEVIATANGHPSPQEFIPLPPEVVRWAQQPQITPDEAMISQARKFASQARYSNILQSLWHDDWEEAMDNLLSRL